MANRIIRTAATAATYVTRTIIGTAPAPDVTGGVIGTSAASTIGKSTALAAVADAAIPPASVIANPVVGTSAAAHIARGVVAAAALANMV